MQTTVNHELSCGTQCNAMQHFGGTIVAACLNVNCSNPLEECRKTTKISDKIYKL